MERVTTMEFRLTIWIRHSDSLLVVIGKEDRVIRVLLLLRADHPDLKPEEDIKGVTNIHTNTPATASETNR